MSAIIIDDDLFAKNLLVKQVQKLTLSIAYGCSTASEALSIISRNKSIDLIFCDIQMPEMDGVEFIRYLSANNYKGNLVLVSGQDYRLLKTVERLAKAHNLNLVSALKKPVSMIDLTNVFYKIKNHSIQFRKDKNKLNINEIESALKNNQFFIQYQPKVLVQTGEYVGAEALVRWMHPEHGIIMPDVFIEIAEEYGLINDITDFVIKTSVDDQKRWAAEGLQGNMAINISTESLSVIELPEKISKYLLHAGIPNSNIILEITESRLLKNINKSLDVLARLRLKNFNLSIDDFGTGHSSLAQLRDVPFNELKIDRSFVHGANNDKYLKAIIQASSEMAHKFEMKVVAEGVEDHEDWNLIKSLGCDVAQGWFISKSINTENMVSWYAGWKEKYLTI